MAVDSQGSWLTGLFLFNVIVATGTFALPAIFNDAGVVLSSVRPDPLSASANTASALLQVFLLVVVFTTHTTTMYVMEAVTTVGLMNHLSLKSRCGDTPALKASGHGDEIKWPTQISQVNTALLPTAWRIAWFFILIVYLYPDLAVYSVFISDTVQVVFPVIDFAPEFFVSGDGVYFTALFLSSIFLTPWVFGSFKGTTALQVTTTVTRNVLLWSMIVIAVCMLTGSNVGQLDRLVENSTTGNTSNTLNGSFSTQSIARRSAILGMHQQPASWAQPLATLHSAPAVALPHMHAVELGAGSTPSTDLPEVKGEQAAHTPASSGHGHREDLPWADFSKVPLLFGGIVYSTIHQQYAPSILSPLRGKRKNLLRVHRSVLGGVTLYYLALCLTAVAAFSKYAGVGDAAVAAAGGEETQCNALTPHPCQLQALYTFNFGFVKPAWFARFIAMAPLLSMLSNFPLIAMTLRDNLMILAAIILQHCAHGRSHGVRDSRGGRPAPGGGYLRVSVSEPGSSTVDATGTRTVLPSSGFQIASTQDAQSSAATSVTVPVRHAAGGGAESSAVLVHPLDADGPQDADAAPLVESRRRDSATHRLQLGSGAAASTATQLRAVGSRPDSGSQRVQHGTWEQWAEQTAQKLTNPTDAPFEMRVTFALLSVVPAYISAALTRDIDFLLRIVGCFGGSFIAFVMPCVLLQYAREAQQLQLPSLASSGNTKVQLSNAGTHRRLEFHQLLFRAPNGGRWSRMAIIAFAISALAVNTFSLFTEI